MRYTVTDVENNKRSDFLTIVIPLLLRTLPTNIPGDAGILGDAVVASYVIPEDKSAITAAYEYRDWLVAIHNGKDHPIGSGWAFTGTTCPTDLHDALRKGNQI